MRAAQIFCANSISKPGATSHCPILCNSCKEEKWGCQLDSQCRTCKTDNGRCQRCHTGYFLFFDECISAEECSSMKGKIPLGAFGGVCQNIGYSCSKSNGPDCDPPTGLGDACGGFKVKNSGEIECTECDTSVAWFTKGKCLSQRPCKRTRFTDTANGQKGECDCRELQPDGEIEQYCGTCNLAKVLPATNGNDFKPTPSSQFRECTSCRKKRVLQDAVCRNADDVVCPPREVLYSTKTGSSCEAPFSCDTGVKADGPEEGKPCGCLVPDFCQQCDWGKKDMLHACTVCKKHLYLLNGECISKESCINSGLIPKGGKGPRGLKCEA